MFLLCSSLHCRGWKPGSWVRLHQREAVMWDLECTREAEAIIIPPAEQGRQTAEMKFCQPLPDILLRILISAPQIAEITVVVSSISRFHERCFSSFPLPQYLFMFCFVLFLECLLSFLLEIPAVVSFVLTEPAWKKKVNFEEKLL